jgi:2-oxoglutarate ferredoxin oxidoreductase subunit beta
MPEVASKALTKKDFQTDQEVRWCPGCGDYAILNSVQQVFPKLGIPREKFVIISGIGCSSRFPYYMNTYGFHSIHGRALAIASGVSIANPDMSVWVVTGDGDCMSIGGNHFIHMLRRNLNIKVLMFNNRIYGLTKGQCSPTSEQGKVNPKGSPLGTIERPINPISMALASGATFVARTVDIYAKHLQEIVTRAAAHRGAAVVEIYQNCNVFNDHAFENLTEKEVREERNIMLEHGKPLRFGKGGEWGLRANGITVEKVKVGENGVTEKDLIVHDEKFANASLAYLESRIRPPEFPEIFGVFRSVDYPSYEEGVIKQIRQAREKAGDGDVAKLLRSGDTWTVK